MEYSPMMVVILWALTPSDAQETLAKVVELPHRVMSIQPLATFNHGKPFLAERDPVTGALDLKTTPVNADDYLYEEYEESGESIDRKDGASSVNHIVRIPAKDSELHKFLNLPVHYASSSKYPLISSSYANTKVQGHGANNHRPASTSTTTSTVSPSYYPHKTSTTPVVTPSTSVTTTVATTRATTTTTTTAKPLPSYEYEYEYDYGDKDDAPHKNDYEFLGSSSETGYSPVSPSTSTTTTSTSTSAPRTSTTTTRPTSTSTEPSTVRSTTTSTTLIPPMKESPRPFTQFPDIRTSTNRPQNKEKIVFPSSSNDDENKEVETTTESKRVETTTVQKEDKPVVGLFPPVKPLDLLLRPPPETSERVPSSQQQKPAPPTQQKPPENVRPSRPPSQTRPLEPARPQQLPPRPENTNEKPTKSETPDYIAQWTANIQPLLHQVDSQSQVRPTYERPLPYQPTKGGESLVYTPRPESAQKRPVESFIPRPTQEQKRPAEPARPQQPYAIRPQEPKPFQGQPDKGSQQVVWPKVRPPTQPQPQGQPEQQKPTKPFFSFFPRPSESNARPPSGVGTVEAVRPPGRPTITQVPAPHSSSSPTADSQSYSLQTSFSIGVPPTSVDDNKHPTSQQPLVKYPQQSQPSQTPLWGSHSTPHNKPYKHPEGVKRKPLPNILPQFRPNAKIGTVEPFHHGHHHAHHPPSGYLREPMDTLQPPPLPRPAFLRSDEPVVPPPPPPPPVHRRNGIGTKVTTLQMMQQPPSTRRAEEPLLIVYPSNNAADGVVMGTRGQQRPLPPDNLGLESEDSFLMDGNKNYQPRVDTPILKGKPSSKPHIKVEFPYPLVKPLPEETTRRKEDEPNDSSSSTVPSAPIKEYTAFSPTSSTNSDRLEPDSEINLIPYLQDYLPMATKATHRAPQPQALPPQPSPSTSPVVVSTSVQPPARHRPEALWTVGQNKPISVTLNTTSDKSGPPKPQELEAPFEASPSQGWSVVTDKSKTTSESSPTPSSPSSQEEQTTSEDKFDMNNFKPQLFGGFQPIASPSSGSS